jgi:hypothetical protein
MESMASFFHQNTLKWDHEKVRFSLSLCIFQPISLRSSVFSPNTQEAAVRQLWLLKNWTDIVISMLFSSTPNFHSWIYHNIASTCPNNTQNGLFRDPWRCFMIVLNISSSSRQQVQNLMCCQEKHFSRKIEAKEEMQL